jgi:hypothetical protein
MHCKGLRKKHSINGHCLQQKQYDTIHNMRFFAACTQNDKVIGWGEENLLNFPIDLFSGC